MYEVKVISGFSGAHNLRHYKGKCEDLHGHNWKVELAMEAAGLDKLPFFKDINPTSENIAKFIHDELDLKSAKITVWETPTSVASYYKT